MRTRSIGIALIAISLSFPITAWSQSTKAPPKKTPTPLMSGDGWKLVRSVQLGTSGRFIHTVLIDPKRDSDKTVYGAALKSICRSELEFCRVRFWNQARDVADKITFTESQFKMLRAEFNLNLAGGIEELRYACTVAHENKQCFSH